MSLKTITAAVGKGCKNIPSDVSTVQYLLNFVPVSQGGPLQSLKIDGFAGVVTIEAINRFQKLHFGLSKGCLEFNEETFIELKKYDPVPYSLPVVAPNTSASKAEKMDPSKMNHSIGKSVEGGNIKRRLYAGVMDDSI